MKKRNILLLLLILSILILTVGCEIDDILDLGIGEAEDEDISEELKINKDGSYNTVEEVSLYLHIYEELPDNFITKKEARKLGWDSKEGNLWKVTDEKSIGGDRFGNREGLLPEEEGREYYECDINYEGGYRGSERIVYSHDGLIYYTDDHYNSFTQIYGDE